MPPRLGYFLRSKHAILRFIVVFIVAGAALWLSTAITISMVLAQRAPEFVVGWWPASASARAAIAEQILQDRSSSPDQIARARELALAALRREAVNVVASRTLALAAARSGESGRADRLFTYSEALSRRDIPTQLWMIEDRVEHNDIAAALTHYDRALRISEETRDLLLPLLARASAAPAITPQVAELVAARPLWWPYFIDSLLGLSNSPEAVALIVRRLRLDPASDVERPRLVRALARLVSLGAYQPAYAIYRTAVGRSVADGLVRNGGFESEGGLGTFDWTFVDEPGLAAVREAREGASGNAALSIMSSSERNGEVARQLILLSPGSYRLSAKAGFVPQDLGSRPVLTLICGGTSPRAIAQLVLEPAGQAGRLNERLFAVPATGCPAQWLTISTGPRPTELATTPWIDAVEVATAR